MKLNILLGAKAGQGVNKIANILSKILTSNGYYVFNYRDYGSFIRGGHNYNILTLSDKKVGSNETQIDILVAVDEETLKLHKSKLKKSPNSTILSYEYFQKDNLGINLNVALTGQVIKLLGLTKEDLIKEIKEELNTPESIAAAEKGYNSIKENKFNLKKINTNKITSISTGSQAVALGALNSEIKYYFSYPMTPATGVMHSIASYENNPLLKNKTKPFVFQSENEIAVINNALGASFAGAKSLVGTAGGGFDLMIESLSFQGQLEIPLCIYVASRPGPGTGVPTYTSQADINTVVKSGHGEFPRIVIAPGDPIECIEKTNEALYLAHKFNTLSIILSDKHLAESEFSSDRKPNQILKVEFNRFIPGKEKTRPVVKASGYEHENSENAFTTESMEIAKKNADERIKKYEDISKECEKKFEMVKLFGNKDAENLIIGWGSNKTVILDALDSIDNSISNPTKTSKFKFLQILYLKPMSNKIKEEMLKLKPENIFLIEGNSTGQLGRLIREKTGIAIPEKNRILKYDGMPFFCDELKNEILKRSGGGK